ncbi:MAG: hypothetical protein KDD99_24260, partial [Bacteroidetes bacterium]|nr:hypothetical protein [Bacteroidota bacterium]
MSELARRLIAENLSTKNPYLDLGRCGLTDDNFPEEITQLTHLETLVLSNEWVVFDEEKFNWELKKSENKGLFNHFRGIPDVVTELGQLKGLFYGDSEGRNRLGEPEVLGRFENLEALGLHNVDLEKLEPLA